MSYCLAMKIPITAWDISLELKPLHAILQRALLLIIGGFLLLGRTELNAGAVDDYLASKEVVTHPSWVEGATPKEMIPVKRIQLKNGPANRDRGIAVANLAIAADNLSKVPKTQNAAKELLQKEVMPNLHFCKEVEETSACSWTNTLIGMTRTLRSLKDREGEESCLRLLENEAPLKDDREMAIYLSAYCYAKYGEYSRAIETYNRLPEESKWSNHRAKTINYWKVQQKKEEEKAKKNIPATSHSSTPIKPSTPTKP